MEIRDEAADVDVPAAFIDDSLGQSPTRGLIHPDGTVENVTQSTPETNRQTDLTQQSEPTTVATCVQLTPTPLPPLYLTIPAESHIERCKTYFLSKYRKDFDLGLSRRAVYGIMIQEKVRDRGLPEALTWIPMVETWFDNQAYSRSHAAGLWQLIPATAHSFNLRIDDWVDERYDPEKATDAALDVLEYLYGKTGDWLLAIAAYNAGEGCVNRAIRRTGSRDYWVLAHQRKLPSQTRFYVAAILALSEIGRVPEKYDVTIPGPQVDRVESIQVNHQVNLRRLAEKENVSINEIKRLNPSLKTTFTPPEEITFIVRVPKGYGQVCQDEIDYLVHSQRDHLVIHKIQPGDTLTDLARQYKSTVDAIMAANQMSRHLIIAGKTLIIPAGLRW